MGIDMLVVLEVIEVIEVIRSYKKLEKLGKLGKLTGSVVACSVFRVPRSRGLIRSVFSSSFIVLRL